MITEILWTAFSRIRLNTIILVMRSVVCGSIATGLSPFGEQLSLSPGFSFLHHLLIMLLNSYLVSFKVLKNLVDFLVLTILIKISNL